MALLGPALFVLPTGNRAPQCRFCGCIVERLWWARLTRTVEAACASCWYAFTESWRTRDGKDPQKR